MFVLSSFCSLFVKKDWLVALTDLVDPGIYHMSGNGVNSISAIESRFIKVPSIRI